MSAVQTWLHHVPPVVLIMLHILQPSMTNATRVLHPLSSRQLTWYAHNSTYPALAKLCGCTPPIPVITPATWEDVTSATYADVQPTDFAANILAMCNHQAVLVPQSSSSSQLLAAGQMLHGICLTLNGKSFAGFLQEAKQTLKEVAAKVGHIHTAESGTIATSRNVTVYAARNGSNKHSAAVGNATCSVNWGPGNHTRGVYLTNGTCPMLPSRCSGLSAALPHQDELSPCCQAHAWCYTCGWEVGWTERNCDALFYSNMYTACDDAYPNSTMSDIYGWGACRTAADSMYAAMSVSHADDNPGWSHRDCSGEAVKLAAVPFCFNAVYVPSEDSRLTQVYTPAK